MAHNRTSQYSAPYKRNGLLRLHQYAASDHFPSLGRWDTARSEDLYVVRGTAARTRPVNIIVVGAISSDRACLRPHGNYDPNFMLDEEQIAKKAKLQFVITSPEDDPGFSADYALSLSRLKDIQEEVAASQSGPRNHFIQGSNMKMNFLLFSEKEPDEPNPTSSLGAITEDPSDGENHATLSSATLPVYEVAEPYRHAWRSVNETHSNNIMEVYGTNELPVDYRFFDRYLRSGTTVSVTFTLKHFAIRERGSTQILSDTFSASVQSVSILKEAEPLPRRSFNSLPKRRPLPVPQFPSRLSLQLAANAFSPVTSADVHGASTDARLINAPATKARQPEHPETTADATPRSRKRSTVSQTLAKSTLPTQVETAGTPEPRSDVSPASAEVPTGDGASSPDPSSHQDDGSSSSLLDSVSSLSDVSDSDNSVPPLEPVEDFIVEQFSSEGTMSSSTEEAGAADDGFSSWVEVPSIMDASEKVSPSGRATKTRLTRGGTTGVPEGGVSIHFGVPSEIENGRGTRTETSERTTRPARSGRKPRKV